MPTATIQKSAISLTKTEADRSNAERVVDAGKVMATTKVAFDRQFIEPLNGLPILVHWKDAPTEKGLHYIDRKNRVLRPISENEANELKLEWHEKLQVYETALQAVKERRPLKLGIDHIVRHHDSWFRLALLGGYLGGIYPVAQVEAGHKAAAMPETPIEELRR
jgi:hypothetical protein